jgi:hypothetical protein
MTCASSLRERGVLRSLRCTVRTGARPVTERQLQARALDMREDRGSKGRRAEMQETAAEQTSCSTHDALAVLALLSSGTARLLNMEMKSTSPDGTPVSHAGQHAAHRRFWREWDTPPTSRKDFNFVINEHTIAVFWKPLAFFGQPKWCYIQHTVRYSELSPERFRDFWKD